MTKRDITDIALKIVGLYMLTLALESLTGLIKSTPYFFYPDTESATESLIYLVANSFRTCLYAFGFYFLTIKTTGLTKKLIKTDTDPGTFTIDKTDMLQILFCVAGILITFFAVSEFWTQMTMTSLYDYSFVPENKRTIYYMLMLGVPTTKGIIGLTFIFFSGGLSRLLTRNKNEK